MGSKPEGPIHRRVPPGDDRERLVCADCGFVWYQNPVIVVGTVPLWQEQVALVERDIEPRRGFWTLPAGFLEVGETVQQGAVRETLEEANAEVEVDGLLGIYDVPAVRQVHMFFRACLSAPQVSAGHECSDARLFSWDEIPWQEIAFPSSAWALEHALNTRDSPLGQPFTNHGAPPTLEEWAETHHHG